MYSLKAERRTRNGGVGVGSNTKAYPSWLHYS